MASKTPDLWLFGLGFILLAYGAVAQVFPFAIVGFALLGTGALARLMTEKGDERALCSALRLIAYPISVIYVYALVWAFQAAFGPIPSWLQAVYYLVYFVILFGADRVYSVEEKREAVAVAIWKSFRIAAVVLAIFVAASAAAVWMKLF